MSRFLLCTLITALVAFESTTMLVLLVRFGRDCPARARFSKQ